MDARARIKMMEQINRYKSALTAQLNNFDWKPVESLAKVLGNASKQRANVFICGNGGSAGNAMHLANDFIYGVDPSARYALKVEALTANSSILTCLGNDVGYDNIFSHQLKVKAKTGDILIVLSGSGNSPNILNALQTAKVLNMRTAAILGFKGGKALELAEIAIHFPIDDMQIAEDLQLIVGHILMQQLAKGIE